MSDKFTSVETDGGHGYGMWGHLDVSEAVEQARLHFERQVAEGRSALAQIIAGRVHVFHQLGPDAARNRRLVSEPLPAQRQEKPDER